MLQRSRRTPCRRHLSFYREYRPAAYVAGEEAQRAHILRAKSTSLSSFRAFQSASLFTTRLPAALPPSINDCLPLIPRPPSHKSSSGAIGWTNMCSSREDAQKLAERWCFLVCVYAGVLPTRRPGTFTSHRDLRSMKQLRVLLRLVECRLHSMPRPLPRVLDKPLPSQFLDIYPYFHRRSLPLSGSTPLYGEIPLIVVPFKYIIDLNLSASAQPQLDVTYCRDCLFPSHVYFVVLVLLLHA
ncbi:hypothetical protein FB451DRAFT_1561423, partial [Mycena latifolia]